MLRIIILAAICIYRTNAYSAATCPSTIAETDRVDCYSSSGANEADCLDAGCMWCETSDYNNPNSYPWCFYDSPTIPEEGECTSCTCTSKVDCYPQPGSSEEGCLGRGCIWCPSNIQGVPWCIVGSGGDVSPDSGMCSAIQESKRLDCYPESGASEQGCYSRECFWCETNTPNIPWCFYNTTDPSEIPDGGGNTGNSGSCPTTIPENSRIDCWPGSGATSSGCVNSGCIWCASNTEGVPWCFFNTTDLPPGIEDSERINCIPEGGFNPTACSERGCQFASIGSPAAPLCYFPSDYGYVMVGDPIETQTGYSINLQRVSSGTVFGDDVDSLTLTFDFDSDHRLHWKFFDDSNGRFEVPLPINGASTKTAANPLYDVTFSNDPTFSFKIIRKSTGAVLWDTSLGGLTFSDQFLQIATRIPEGASVYGFGETEHAALLHKFDWSAWGMYARDQPPAGVGNLYSVFPFYVAIEQDANSHGVLLLNSNAQDITFTPAPGLLYRTIGGVLDFYMFLGPEPNTVIEQYSLAVGPSFFPPYWSLGFQLCRYGYGDLATVKTTVNEMNAYNIPQDVQYGDIDYMDEQRDFTYSLTNYDGLPDYVKELQAEGKHYVIILDPCLTKDDPPGAYPPYERGFEKEVYVKNAKGADLTGKVWPPGESVFPDYSNPDTVDWWSNECQLFHGVIPFDGLWIDMNEPANFGTGSTTGCETNSLNNPPYHPLIWGDVLADKTICPDSMHAMGTHYDTHSLYGWSESAATYIAAIDSTGKRPFVVSRSTFPGSGQWSAHWLGDNNADWSDLKNSIIGMLEFNMFGIPYVGADICGFNGAPSEELCARWMELGSFYPYARNHNGIGYPRQDPAAFGAQFAANSREVLNIRYTLLPYLYTLFYYANVKGSSVVRPLSFEFTSDINTMAIDEQFMWGGGLLFSPVLYEGLKSVDAYFPDAPWFDYSTGKPVGTRSASKSIPADIGTIPIHVRGGFIIPTQDPAVNTVQSRNNPFGLIIALGDDGTAHGTLYWDDGDSLDVISKGHYALLEFSAANSKLTTAVLNDDNIAETMVMGTLRIFGVLKSPSAVTVNGISQSFTYSNEVIQVTNLLDKLSADYTVDWS